MAKKQHKHNKLNQYFATSICGNDILSSCLYVSGIAITFAGIFAPLVLAFIGLILFFYKAVYTEVVEALPINGGAYNCLLNSTSKTIAAIAGVTTVLSYVATSVLSGEDSIQYLHTIFTVPIIPMTIVLLSIFAILVIIGLKDSAKVALGIFSTHIGVMTIFVAIGIWHIFTSGHVYFAENLMNSQKILLAEGGLSGALFFGFAASLLGVSGFESSANFVEEQDKGVFRKTLRNMLIGVVIFNPLIALIVLGISPLDQIIQSKDFLLATEANVLGGGVFQVIVALDAFLVLAGAVLTSFVGVSGLVSRMAADACLPGFFSHQNGKGSFPYIVVGFFLLCTSILLLTKGNLLSLAGVYTIAFLSVMSLFALGNLILRQTRSELKRTYDAPVLFVVMAFTATALGIIGNIKIDVNNFIYFSIYFIPAVLIVLAVVYEDVNMRILLHLTKHIKPVHRFIENYFVDITSGTVVVFVNHVNRLYQILSYVSRNEAAKNVILVHCKNWDNKSDMKRFNDIKKVLPFLQEAGAFNEFNIDLVYKDKPFGPQSVEELSKSLKVRKNRMMIGSIHHFHDFDYSELGGVRIII